MLYKNLLHSVETSKKAKDFADKPLVSDDGLVILAHKVILVAFPHTDIHIHTVRKFVDNL